MKLKRFNNLSFTAIATPFVMSLATCLAASPATQSEANAAEYYVRASRATKTDCPSDSAFDFREYPPFGEKWDELAKASWEQDAETRRLVHQASSLNTADWTIATGEGDPSSIWNHLRHDANVIADAAEYQHFQHDDAGALNLLNDLNHMTDLLQKDIGPEDLVRQLVAIGLDALMTDRMSVVVSDCKLSSDPTDVHAIPIPVARRWIDRLLKIRVLPNQAAAGVDKIGPLVEFGNMNDGRNRERVIEQVNRINTDRAMTAMSLACHVFQFDHQRWPASLQELIPIYLSSVPVDPWGDGKQTLGYTLIKAARPDGSDRPLVYRHEDESNGDILFYRTDRPTIGYYNPFIRTSAGTFRHGGQFRDVTAWVPNPDVETKPTTQPLQ